MEDIENFSVNIQELIIRTRLDLEKDFQEGRKKKSFLWRKVLEKIKEIKPDFEMTREQISRKFLNLHTTYKRIKKRTYLTGRCATSWEFYDIFDEVYGAKHSINSPIRNLPSSLSIMIKDEVQDEVQDFIINDSICSSDNMGEENLHQKEKRQKISSGNEILEFLEKEAKRDEKRHKEIMEIERCKIELEREKIKIMIDLKNILSKMQEKCIKTEL